MNFIGSNIFSIIKARNYDLGTDRLNYYYSTYIISFMALTVTARQFVGSPLQCWVPAFFTDQWEKYAESYCFVYNTYWTKPNEDLPKSLDERINNQLIYYQWAPFIMLIEAGFFYFPVIIWGMLSSLTGMNIERIVETAMKAEGCSEEDRKKHIDTICIHIHNHSRPRPHTETTYFGCKCRKIDQLRSFIFSHGTALRNSYVLTKFIYMANLLAQFYSTNKFLGQNDPYWGYYVGRDIFSGDNWEETGNFPRIAMCDFQVRELGQQHRYSIQCVLSLNMFNEKIFLFLYWWFAIVLVITFIDTYKLIRNIWTEEGRVEFIREFLQKDLELDVVKKKSDKKNMEVQELLQYFCSVRLSPDIIMLLKMINGHTSEVVSCDILTVLWAEYIAAVNSGEIRLSQDEEESIDLTNMARGKELQPLVSP